MLGRLFLAFTLIPMVELALLVEVGGHIGTLPTLALVVATGFVGAWLARLAGLATLRRIQGQMSQGRLPADELVDGALILGAGFMLVTPGVLTDAFALCLLTPWGRLPVRRWLRRRLERAVSSGVVTIDVPQGPE